MEMIIKTKKHGEFVVLIDAIDYPLISQHKWYIQINDGRKTPVVGTKISTDDGKKTTVKMHRLIMDAPSGTQIDHVNGNGLDNRRTNLRYCTGSENCANRRVLRTNKTSKYRGVYFAKAHNTFVASIKKNGKNIKLGTFKNELDAARVYDKAALEIFGQFAITNQV